MLSYDEVHRIAKLARLELSEDEIKKYRKDLSVILDYVAQLQKLEVSGISPMSHSVEVEGVMRKDDVKPESAERINALLESAPRKERGYIRTKAILEV